MPPAHCQACVWLVNEMMPLDPAPMDSQVGPAEAEPAVSAATSAAVERIAHARVSALVCPEGRLPPVAPLYHGARASRQPIPKWASRAAATTTAQLVSSSCSRAKEWIAAADVALVAPVPPARVVGGVGGEEERVEPPPPCPTPTEQGARVVVVSRARVVVRSPTPRPPEPGAKPHGRDVAVRAGALVHVRLRRRLRTAAVPDRRVHMHHLAAVVRARYQPSRGIALDGQLIQPDGVVAYALSRDGGCSVARLPAAVRFSCRFRVGSERGPARRSCRGSFACVTISAS